MPSISKKGINMPSSPIRKLVPFAEKAEAEGKTVYYLNIGQPDIKTPEVAFDALMIMDRKNIAYSHSAGGANYRKGLSDYYKSVGIDVSDDEIMVTTGGSEALLFSFLSTLNPGEEIIIPEPFYANYNGFAQYAGINITPVTANIEDGFALPPIEAFEEKINANTKGIVICNPGNPTGYLYSKEELERLRDIVKKHDLYLYADEVYREFCYDGAEPFSVMNLEGIENNVILIDSVSKRYSMCGARIGALITRNKEVFDTAMKFAQARLSPPTLGQVVAEAALKTPQSYFDEVISTYVDRRNALVEGLNSIDGVFCPMPKGAFYCVAKLPVDSTENFCQWLLEEFDYQGKTVMMAPASGFYASPGLGTQEVRLAYVLEKSALLNAVEVIREALKVYPGRIQQEVNVSEKENSI
ncbi:pyridoxal phosphate-dependent aminotransferase [Paracrocinitomix mangrovi]|uniref:pyridoxal phosphate-dependent aminotransferase n=1 Tax=Paracrocinitomix mangrovi TaxID=2862509 RepID=UPI001C8E5175|nr:pyridoxal phosphate-dependent aminotransferase [Paracrocinitomix mangrovi]UKN02473.1 pyridoxal phosphate-dependent aminotransferase [Paracrocinitomix mangrovi]